MIASDRDLAVGIDLGGTNVRAALIRGGDGSILAHASEPIQAEQGPERGVHRIGDLVARVLDEARCPASALAGIGIGATGPLDAPRGLLLAPWTLPGWDDVPIAQTLADRFGLPAYLDNDANVATLGEHWLGAGRGCADMIYLTVSTGIGAGIIIHNRLHRGIGTNAGEVGLMTIAVGGPALEDVDGAWEAMAAGPAMARMGRARADADMLAAASGDPAQITGKLVAQLAAQGHPIARAIIDEIADLLGVGIANLLVVLAPQIVVMGGGVMESWDLLQPRMELVARARTRLLPGLDAIPLVRAALGGQAGIFGAARLVFVADEG